MTTSLWRDRRGVTAMVAALLLATSPVFSADEHDDEHEHAHEHDAARERTFTVEELQRSGVSLASAGSGEVDLGVELPGEVRPNADRLAHIAARFPGIVREVRKHVGDEVRAGDVLAIVESENLAPFEVKAAFAGTVIDKHIAPGEAVTREQPAFIVADLSTVWVDITVYQSALAQVRVGQPVLVTSSRGELEASGAIAYITPVVDQATRTASARVVLPNPSGAWRPGLFVSAIVLSPVEAPVVVPRRALQTMDGRRVVFVVDDDHFDVRPVRVGREGRTRVEILDGLAAGERFADERSFLVKAELGKRAAAHAH